MKHTPNLQPDTQRPLLAFGAHPDDIEFGCGGVVALEARRGRKAHFVICSRGEAASHGTPRERTAEAQRGAEVLQAGVHFVELDGDARLEVRASHAIQLARIVRQTRPAVVLAPTLAENQHPDHPRLGRLVRDAVRIARYGGLEDLRDLPPHAIDQLLFYAITPHAEPPGAVPLLVDISDPDVIADWKAAMEAHVSQTAAREYVELQLSRARYRGLSAGVAYATALYPNDPIVVESLETLSRGARRF